MIDRVGAGEVWMWGGGACAALNHLYLPPWSSSNRAGEQASSDLVPAS